MEQSDESLRSYNGWRYSAMTRPLECPCGSGLEPEEQVDGYGIFLCYTCEQCEKKKLAGFRPDIFTQYDTDEQIEDDY
jgi:hypothetical protein